MNDETTDRSSITLYLTVSALLVLEGTLGIAGESHMAFGVAIGAAVAFIGCYVAQTKTPPSGEPSGARNPSIR